MDDDEPRRDSIPVRAGMRAKAALQSKWGRRIVRATLIGAVAIIAGGIWISQTDWGEERVRALVVDTLASELGLQAQLEAIQIQWGALPPSLTVRASGIDLTHPTEGTLATADALIIRPSLIALFRGRLDLQTIELHRPRVRLRIDEHGVVNLPTLPSSNSEAAIDLPFTRLEITDGVIEVDAAPVALGRLDGVGIEVDADGDEVVFAMTTAGGTLEHSRGVETIAELALNGAADLDQSVTLHQARLRTEHVDVATHNAQVRFGDAPKLSYGGHVVASFDLAHLAQLPLEIDLPALEGRVAVEADLEAHEEGGLHGRGVLQLLGVKVDDRWGVGESLALQLSVTPEEITILEGSEARLPLNGGSIAVTGSVKLDPEAGYPIAVDADIDMQFAKLMHMLSVTPDTPVWWPMQGSARLEGTLDPLSVGGPIDIRTRDFLVTVGPHHERPRERVIGVEQGHTRGKWLFTDEALVFEDLRLITPRSNVLVSLVHIGYDNTFRVKASSESFDLRDLSPLTNAVDIAGAGRVEISIGPDFDHPYVEGSFSLADFQFANLRLGDVSSDFRVRDDYYGVSLPEVTAVKGNSRYRVDDLNIDFIGGVRADGELYASRIALSDVYHLFSLETDERFEPFEGTGRGHMGLHFSYGHPGDSEDGSFRSAMDFELLDAELAGVTFDGGRLQGRLDWADMAEGIDGATLDIDHFGLRKDGASVTVQGRMAQLGVLDMTVAADQVALAQTAGIGESLPELGGSYSVLGRITGTAELPRLDLDVMLTGLSWGDTVLGDARFYVKLTDPDDPWVATAARWTEVPSGAPCGAARRGLASADWPPGPPIRTAQGLVPRSRTPQAFLICGEGLDGQVKVDVALGWTNVYPVRGVVDLVGLQLEPFLGRQLETDALRGVVDGRLAFTGGALLEDRSLDGRISFSRVSIEALGPDGAPRVELHNDGPIAIELAHGGARIQRLQLASAANSGLRATGSVSPRGRLDMALDGHLDLAILSTLSSEVAASSGAIRMHVDLGGPMSNPAVYGNADVVDGRLALEGVAPRVRALNGRVRFDARRILFESFEGRIAGGRFTMQGAASLRDASLQRYAFEATMQNAMIIPEDGVEVGFGGKARLGWKRGDRLPLLSGTVRLGRVSYRRPIQLSPTLGQLYRPQVVEVERYDPEDDNLAIDLRVETRAPVRVVNNLLDVSLRVDEAERPFRIVGTDQRWGVVGDIDIPRGTVRFRNTELSVTRGDIAFQDETRVDPHFDVTAVTEIRRQASAADLTAPAWRIRLNVHGTIDAFQMDASSTPSLSQEDLMLLLTVGMTSAEAQQLQAGDVGGTALEALSALAGVNEEVTSAVGVIDDFAVTTRYSPDTGRPEPMLTVGKRITERVRLSAATGLTGADRTFQTGVEWRVGDQTSVQMSYDNVNRESNSNFGNVGLDFHWRLEFE